MIDSTIKSKEYYDELKALFNKKYNLIYKENYSPKANIGDCSYLYKKYRPTSYEDFFARYLADADTEFSMKTHKGDRKHGRSLEQLECLAECYFNEIVEYNKKHKKKNDVTLQMCFDDLFNHIIIETFDGKKIERFFSEMIKNSSDDFVVNECVGPMDSELGVDIIVRKKSDNDYIRYLQIKPNTFFAITKNQSLVDDRRNARAKENKLREIVGEDAKIEYIVYDKHSYLESEKVMIAKMGNKTKFKLSDLIYDNGIPKFDILRDFTYEIPGKQKEDERCN